MKKINFSLFIICLLIASCSFGPKPNQNIIKIDLNKDYPIKQLYLTDICDIEYVSFESEKDDYLFNGFIAGITDQTIMITDNRTGAFHFFSIDGKHKSKFSRRGTGPEEYTFALNAVYDEKKDEVFILSVTNTLNVYNSQGDYKRSLKIESKCEPVQIIDFDESSLLLFDSYKIRKLLLEGDLIQPNDTNLTNFIRISKTDGQIIEYIQVPEDYSFLLGVNHKKVGRNVQGIMCHILRHKDGLLLLNQETDTIFYYEKNRSLQPLWIQHPSAKSMSQPRYINPFLETGKYQFFEKTTLDMDEWPLPITYMMRDKANGEIYKQQIIFDEFQEKEVNLSFKNIMGMVNSKTGYIMLNTFELLEAYEENRLSGELKELVADMGEEDNGILVLLHFK